MSLRGAFGFIRGQSLFDVTVVRGANCLAGGEVNVVAALGRLRRLDAATARKAVNFARRSADYTSDVAILLTAVNSVYPQLLVGGETRNIFGGANL